MPNKRVYDIKIAIERLRNYCALQDKCQWDVIQKMQEWGLLKISQDHILELLIKEKYVDEERYSRSFCRGKFRIKKWGKIKITNELKKKYISEVCITKGLEEINDSEYQEELDKQYHKKNETLKEKNKFIKKKKIAVYLISKGYESNLVWDKLRELKE
jgi:regulatory protein